MAADRGCRYAAVALRLRRLLRPGGTITVIEGDHGSAYFHPDGPAAHAAIRCQIELQRRAGRNSLIGRQLYPRTTEADGVFCYTFFKGVGETR